MNHAKLQPSRAHRWLKCLGSAAAEAAAPDVTTEYADRGTALHRLLTGALDDAHLVIHPGRLEFWGDDGKRVAYEVTEADARQVAQVASYVLSTFRAIDGGAVLQTEVYCPVGRHFDLPEDVLSGHADVVIDGDEELVVLDAKFGWQEVEAKGNPQLSLYAIGLAEHHGWRHKRYRLVVAQPECGEPRQELLTADELRARGEALRA